MNVQMTIGKQHVSTPPPLSLRPPPSRRPDEQTTRALVWSGKDPRELGELATFTDRHRSATEAVAEAARRLALLIGTLTTDDGKGPREKAEAQRQWFSVLDRHEAWMRRR